MLLSETQWKTLQALVDCVIPADDYPSGWEAGVGEYLIELLTREPQFLFVYRVGLEAMESEAGSFDRLTTDAQNALLTQWERDARHGPFFRLLVSHVMEGYYADPGNGGNRNSVSWQMIGYEVTA